MACELLPLTQPELTSFLARDETFAGKTSIDTAAMRALDGSSCRAVTPDGVVSAIPSSPDGRVSAGPSACVDLGIEMTYPGLENPLLFLPPASQPHQSATREQSAMLRTQLSSQQFPQRCGRAAASTYYVHEVPLVGFGSIIEYSMMFLARSTTLGARLQLGAQSSRGWTSPWFCGEERSLSCYFNASSCCAVVTLNGRALELPRRRNPLNIGLAGWNSFGSAWLSAELAHFFFERMTPATRREVDRRRQSVLPRGGGTVRAIGMHVRGGDSCHARRFCAKNLTDTFWAQAARLRDRYGVNTIVLATDDARAAALCESRALGFECRTAPIERGKFESSTFIENRVASHASGALSGSAVALDALADIDMLADCSHHVLLLRSAVSRLAFALSLARKGRVAPFISMQWPWSPAHLKRKSKMPTRGRGAGRGRGYRGRPRGR